MAEHKKPPSRRRPADKSPGKRAKKGAEKKPIAGTVVTLVLVVLAFVAGALLVVYPARPAPGSGKVIAVALAGNETPDALADELAAAGVITHPQLFSTFMRVHASGGKLAAGTHVFTDALTPSEVLSRVLRFGAGPKQKVTIPEGWNRFDIGKRLEAKGICTTQRFLEASTSPALLQTMRLDAASFEGFLFPATYDLAEDTLADDVVKTMKLEFDRRYQALADRNNAGILDLAESLHFTEKDIVTLASMVEKEAAVDEERPIIASVFLNRLRDPKFMPKVLQCDPTAAYGCLVQAPPPVSCATFTGKVTHDIVADPTNMYNTYKHEGLPPGPIASPGAKSLDAVMASSETHYFYFVAKGGGHHTFSETYAAHVAAIGHGKDAGAASIDAGPASR